MLQDRLIAASAWAITLLFILLGLTGCGDVPADYTRASVHWELRDGGQTLYCSSRGEDRLITVADFPVGYYCEWDCALLSGAPRYVWLDVANDGSQLIPTLEEVEACEVRR